MTLRPGNGVRIVPAGTLSYGVLGIKYYDEAMKEPIRQAAKRYERIRELDRIAIPLIPTVGVEAAYQQAMRERDKLGVLPPFRRRPR